MAARPTESIADVTAGVRSAVAVAPSDTVDLSRLTRAVFVGVAGNVAVIFSDDPDAAPVTLTGIAVGVWHPMQVRRIMATNTTATGIVAGF